MSQRRVLVADDDRDTAESFAELLRLEGHDVACAPDGRCALELYESFGPDTVILDITMPIIDGREVARRIRRKGTQPRTLLLAMSGWSRPLDVRQSIAAGFDYHFVKPVYFEDLARLLRATYEAPLPLMPRVRGCLHPTITG